MTNYHRYGNKIKDTSQIRSEVIIYQNDETFNDYPREEEYAHKLMVGSGNGRQMNVGRYAFEDIVWYPNESWGSS
jgi:hypothetical protein